VQVKFAIRAGHYGKFLKGEEVPLGEEVTILCDPYDVVFLDVFLGDGRASSYVRKVIAPKRKVQETIGL
jgi:hypothetical protein